MDSLCGTYLPTSSTKKELSRLGIALSGKPRIALLSDGTFSVSDIPSRDGAGNLAMEGGVLSGSGKWSLSHHRDSWELSIDFAAISNSVSGTVEPYTTSFHLLGEKPPYRISQSDPDGADAVEFEKAEEKAK